jgi:tetratricopeptide (TPR) repeat protein
MADTDKSRDGLIARRVSLIEGSTADSSSCRALAAALIDVGLALLEIGKVRDSIDTFDLVVDRFEQTVDVDIRECVAWAQTNKCFALGELGLYDHAIATAKQVVSWRDLPTDEIEFLVAQALCNVAYFESRVGRTENYLDACHELVRRFASSRNLRVEQAVAESVLAQGSYLDGLGRLEEALDSYSLPASLYTGNDDEKLRRLTAEAIANKTIIMYRMSRYGDVTRESDRFFSIYPCPLSEDIFRSAAVMLHYKGRSQVALSELDSARETYQKLLDRVAAGESGADPAVLAATREHLNALNAS